MLCECVSRNPKPLSRAAAIFGGVDPGPKGDEHGGWCLKSQGSVRFKFRVWEFRIGGVLFKDLSFQGLYYGLIVIFNTLLQPVQKGLAGELRSLLHLCPLCGQVSY